MRLFCFSVCLRSSLASWLRPFSIFLKIKNDVVVTLTVRFSNILFSHSTENRSRHKLHLTCACPNIIMNFSKTLLSLVAFQHMSSQGNAFGTGGILNERALRSQTYLEAKRDACIPLNRSDFLKKSMLSSAAFVGPYIGNGAAFAQDETASSRPESLDIDNFLRTGTWSVFYDFYKVYDFFEMK